MIDLSTITLFQGKDNQATLKEISKDTSNKVVQYMTESDREVVNFDMVKRQ